MTLFDVAKDWVILVPPGSAGAQTAARDCARCIAALRKAAGMEAPAPRVADAAGSAPPETSPIVVLNAGDNGPERNGFTWRARERRVEIYGEGERGLCNGVYDFLAALGIRWPAPGQEILPRGSWAAGGADTAFALPAAGACRPSPAHGNGKEHWRRWVVAREDAALRFHKRREALAAWAARNQYDALVFPLKVMCRRGGALTKLAAEHGLLAEAGGRELSVLVPRRYFFLHRDVFRMEEGRRRKMINFCPTNPDTPRILRAQGGKIFRAARGVKTFHLWPDGGDESRWCACPTCRAFTPAEQYRIAVNAAADVLAGISPDAAISFYEKAGEGGGIHLRPNLFRLEELPE
jgi:hypothetical protein